MTPEQFAYWFQGFAELSDVPPTQAQWDSMREHVATVFKKVTPQVQINVTPPDSLKIPPGLADTLRKWNEQGRQAHPFYVPQVTC